MLSTIQRQLTVLRELPRAPQFATARQIQERLSVLGHPVALKTVQRDLKFLRENFPLVRGGKIPEYTWAWSKTADAIFIGGMSSEMAVALKLMAYQMELLMPRFAMAHLKPYVHAADKVLRGERKHSAWTRKVRVIPREVTLPPVVLDRGVVDVLYAALFEDMQCEVTYEPAGRAQPWTRVVNPLGVVFKGAAGYLLCTLARSGEERTLHLARVRMVRKLDTPAVIPARFDLDHAIRDGAFQFFRQGDGSVALTVRVRADVGAFLREERMSEDQTITPDGEWLIVRATVIDSLDVRRFLLSFGADAEVVSPPHLRAAVAEHLARAAQLYGACS